MFYDTLNGMPEHGSLQEAIAVLVQRARAERDRTGLVALVQASMEGVDAKAVQGKLDEYSYTIYPYAEDAIKERDQEMYKALERVAQMGPIGRRRPK